MEQQTLPRSAVQAQSRTPKHEAQERLSGEENEGQNCDLPALLGQRPHEAVGGMPGALKSGT